MEESALWRATQPAQLLTKQLQERVAFSLRVMVRAALAPAANSLIQPYLEMEMEIFPTRCVPSVRSLGMSKWTVTSRKSCYRNYNNQNLPLWWCHPLLPVRLLSRKTRAKQILMLCEEFREVLGILQNGYLVVPQRAQDYPVFGNSMCPMTSQSYPDFGNSMWVLLVREDQQRS